MGVKKQDVQSYPVKEDGRLIFYRDDVSDLGREKMSLRRALLLLFHGKRLRRRGFFPAWFVVFLDVVLLVSCMLTFSLFHHVIPRKMGFKGIQTYGEPGDFREIFSDLFSTDGSVTVTDNSYQSENVFISISTVKENKVTYYVADVYIASIYNFKTALANDTYGRGFTQTTPVMSKNNNAILAMNGDFYGFREQGIVVRNGMVYRTEIWDDACVLYYNGVMETYSASEFDMKTAIDNGAWQAWSFGPAFLDKDGKAITRFESTINGLHPRSAIGYYEPGHYCFVAIDGRQTGHSVGMSFEDMAKLFENLGCKAAYNLDGGKTSVMAFMHKVYNSPYEGGRKCSDIVFIGE